MLTPVALHAVKTTAVSNRLAQILFTKWTPGNCVKAKVAFRS
jgi:hypothetical protein